MSNARKLRKVKVYGKSHDAIVASQEALRGAPLTRREKRSIRVEVPLGSYRIDHLEPHQPYPNCGPKCKELWK